MQFIPNIMEIEKSLEKRIHDKLLAVRRNIGPKKQRQIYNFTTLNVADDVVLNLAFAAEKGELTPEQYRHFDTATRAELVCEFLAEARDLLGQNRTTYGVDTTKPIWKQTDSDMNLEKNVYRLTRAQLSEKYGVDDWHSSYHRRRGEVFADDVLYGRFLREHGLTNQEGAEITEADLPSLESIFKSNHPEVLKRYSALQRGKL